MRYDAGEVITAMVTPFDKNGKVDYNKVEELTSYLIEHGSLQGVPNYPQNFTFAAYRKHGFGHEENAFKDRKEWYEKTQPELNDLYDDYDVLVVPELYGNKPNNCDKWKRLNDQNNIIWVKND